jgi:hypothetical protein
MKPRSPILALFAAAGLFTAAMVIAPAMTRAARQQQPQSPATPSTPSTPNSPASPAGADSLPMPVDELVRRFAQHESEFKIARDNYTYSQSVLVEEAEPDGGQYRLDSEIVFTPQGKRYENVTYAPASSLHLIQLSPEDMKDLENVQPFVLTAEELPKYKVDFVRREKVDELGTYVFEVAPKKIEKGQRYFQGTIWVDDHDLAVVKSDGKAVPDSKDNKFPRFITYRENIEGNFWFPTYTHADDVLHFSNGDVRIRMTVRYKNYKRFGSTVTLGKSRPIDNPPPDAPQPPKQ